MIVEDEKTIRYQVLETLRVEQMFEDRAVSEELDAYNPLIPDRSNLKSTIMLVYQGPIVGARESGSLIGAGDHFLLLMAGETVSAIADDNFDRGSEVKTSVAHFLRFDLSVSAVKVFKADTEIRISIDRPYCSSEASLSDQAGASLCMDLV